MMAMEFAVAGTLEQRLGSIVECYDGQGIHRAGTDVDRLSADWLVTCAQRLGVAATLEPFALDRVDPKRSFLRVGGRCIEGVPLFDAAFTSPDGVRGRLGALGSEAEIAVVETDRFTLMEPQKELRGAVAAARHSGHRAVVVLTRGTGPGLFLLNALSFRAPHGPPMLQVPGEAGAVHRGGGRYVALVCGTNVFHHPADRWPDAVDPAALARYARAFANGASQLTSTSI